MKWKIEAFEPGIRGRVVGSKNSGRLEEVVGIYGERGEEGLGGIGRG